MFLRFHPSPPRQQGCFGFAFSSQPAASARMFYFCVFIPARRVSKDVLFLRFHPSPPRQQGFEVCLFLAYAAGWDGEPCSRSGL